MIEYIAVSQLITIIVNAIYLRKNEIEKIKYCISGFALLSALIAVTVFIVQISNPVVFYKHLYNFMIIDEFDCSIGLLSDSLSITISSVSCIIAALVNFYSIGYVHRNISAFLLYINLFSFFSTLFIAANNLLQMYICLAILSVILYFLIVFDGKQKSLIHGFKIIWLHKFGDIGLIISIIAIFLIFGSLDFDDINKFSIQNDIQMDLIETTAIIMLISIFIKSSQVGFTSSMIYISRLQIPAAAIVNSSIFFAFGIFAMIRLQSFFEFSDFIRNTIIILGAISAIYSAIKAMFSRDINKILAYSTSSQIGLMIVACGFSSYGAAIILFINHAFSKALLFFCAGSVVRALSGEKYIDRMGGLLNLLPKTYVGFIMAALSITCLPLLPYYYAQKILLNDILNSELSLYYTGLIAIVITFLLTNIYVFRTIYFIFYGKNKIEEKTLAYLNENEKYIIKVIYASIFFAVFSGIVFFYIAYNNMVWKDVFAFSSSQDTNIMPISFITNLCGILFAAAICKTIKPKELILQLNLNAFYFQAFMRRSLNNIKGIMKNYMKKHRAKLEKIMNADYCYYLENKLKPSLSYLLCKLVEEDVELV
jgi:NADH-quinone oxidoreductase subunit L